MVFSHPSRTGQITIMSYLLISFVAKWHFQLVLHDLYNHVVQKKEFMFLSFYSIKCYISVSLFISMISLLIISYVTSVYQTLFLVYKWNRHTKCVQDDWKIAICKCYLRQYAVWLVLPSAYYLHKVL
jgi:hypothetical protein